jgi:cytosine/adenosine deaminase-related metal-dependent hydrolase
MIEQRGGFVNAHAHFDRAFTLAPGNVHLTQVSLREKWSLNNDLKRTSSVEVYRYRIDQAVQRMVQQGARRCVTFVDIDPISELRALKAACQVRQQYQGVLELVIANQLLVQFCDTATGRINREVVDVFEEALDTLDVIGGLPDRDFPHGEQHLDIILDAARRTGKPVHVHVDQKNDPNENETLWLAKKVIEYGLEDRVAAIHSVSLSAKPLAERQDIYEHMSEAGLVVIVCPSADLSMQSLPVQAPIHNSIAPVPELLEAGIPIALGTDNIMDIYCPLIDGDLYTELRLLAEACRFYDFEALAGIATQPVPGMQGWTKTS